MSHIALESKEVNEFKDRVKKEAEELIIKTFPTRILSLDKLINSKKFESTNISNVKEEVNIPIPTKPFNNFINDDDSSSTDPSALKKRKRAPSGDGSDGLINSVSHDADVCNHLHGSKVLVLPNGVVTVNQKLTELIGVVKPLIRELVEDANLLKMWILFLIPRIEDGNNFGVSIQEDALSEIRTVEGEAATYFDQISRYYMSRGKVVAKIAKYPHIEDFRKTLEEIDQKEFLSLRLVVAELRNHYATLHDLILKNLEKIKKPRNSNADALY